MPKLVRKLRHWKQRFDPNAAFIWRRRAVWDSQDYGVGEPIPESLASNRRKLRTMWEAKKIELAEFDAPVVANWQAGAATVVTPDPPAAPAAIGEISAAGELEAIAAETPAEPPTDAPAADVGTEPKVERSGAWYTVTFPSGHKQRVRGKDALETVLAEHGE